jgi:hypothetical protein
VKLKIKIEILLKLFKSKGKPKTFEVAIKEPCKVITNIEVAKKNSGKNILKFFLNNKEKSI